MGIRIHFINPSKLYLPSDYDQFSHNEHIDLSFLKKCDYVTIELSCGFHGVVPAQRNFRTFPTLENAMAVARHVVANFPVNRKS